jgi:1,2-diacylglycerol 3-alpha-glucosyltransferase
LPSRQPDFIGRPRGGHTQHTGYCQREAVRIAHFTDTYLPRRDGVITSLRTLVAELRAQGHPQLVVVPRHPDQIAEEGLLRLRAVPCGVADLRLSPWLLRGAAAHRTLAEVAGHAPDAIHVHTPGPVGLLGVLAARRLGLPLVQTYHTDLHAYAEAYHFPVRALRVGVRLYARRLGDSRPLMRTRPPVVRAATVDGPPMPVEPDRRRLACDGANLLLLGKADAVVLPTRAVLDRTELPVSAEKIFLVPTGVAACPTTPAAVSAFRDRHGLAADEPVVLFVGRVNREKGIDLLIAAMPRILAGCPRTRLVLVGALYEPRWLAGLLAQAGAAVAERVVLTGQLHPAEVAAAYAAADVFAFPSRTDTQALVLQEAALAAVPPVLVDAVLHRHGPLGGAGVLTAPDPDDFGAAIVSLLTDPARAARVGAEAAARAAQHTPGRYAETMLGVYQHAVRASVAGRARAPVA